ncbi:MAG: glutamate synthase [Myxococcales bacterium]|nr:glutamate synthase [Myxococcales bacterium]
MAELSPYPFAALIRRMFRELERSESIFDLPIRKCFFGSENIDLSVDFHGARASTPLGPAAGPQSQMAQNIVLSWLSGCRIMELKTVQIMDELSIPRPCIDMQTVGYNIEWSQELKLPQSLVEYVKGSMLVEILQASGALPVQPGYGDVIYDMSVGYDLQGIQTEEVQAFIKGMLDASAIVEELRAQIPDEFSQYRDLDFNTRLSDTLTLSTFHGCPPDEIESIIDFLLRENRLHCIVKLNPMLLGSADTRSILNDALGYRDIRVPESAFERDTTWDQACGFVERLGNTADELGLGFGVKFTNTLIVENRRDFFAESEKEMYLSGPPLHVLAMELVRRFRGHFGDRYPISFSAGIDRNNFPDSVAIGLVPVTVCSDLLKPGGYARTHGYFKDLIRRMDAVEARTVDAFVLKAYGNAEAALDDLDIEADEAKRLLGLLSSSTDLPGDVGAALFESWVGACRVRNTESYVSTLVDNPRYSKRKNSKLPRKIDSKLELFDCITCDKCIPVCPNDANFTFVIPPTEIPILQLRRAGKGWKTEENGILRIEQKHQIANFADFCNDCGNCDVFCPEHGGPYVLKPRFFGSLKEFKHHRKLDGFFVDPTPQKQRIYGRFDEHQYTVEVNDGQVTYSGMGFRVRFSEDDPTGTIEGNASTTVDLTYYHIMALVRTAVLDPSRVNYVNSL